MKPKVVIVSETDDGIIHVIISGKKYVYLIDTAFITELKTLIGYAPGKACQLLRGRAIRDKHMEKLWRAENVTSGS